jgi:iron(III) transport system substrate-binding protein
MTRKAPHPYSALLLYDFMLGEGQKVLADQRFVPSSRKIESPITKVPLKFIDPAMALDHQDKWTKAYEDVVVRPAR